MHKEYLNYAQRVFNYTGNDTYCIRLILWQMSGCHALIMMMWRKKLPLQLTLCVDWWSVVDARCPTTHHRVVMSSTYLMPDLAWLAALSLTAVVPQRIAFKCCLLVYKSLYELAPAYIASSCVKRLTIQSLSGLGSASPDDLVIPATKSKFGERSVAVGGPSAWNALPESVRAAESINIFKCKLKTHCFGLSYDTWCNCKWFSKHSCVCLNCAYGAI